MVRSAFRAAGHDAWSCDFQSPEDGGPHHICADVLDALLLTKWDLAIFHPPCTYLTISSAWAFTDGPYHQQPKPGTLVGAARRAARDAAIEFTLKLWRADIEHICIENPVGFLSDTLGSPTQIVQPHQFGDDAAKRTCLWLKNLPPLSATARATPRRVNRIGGKWRFSNQTDSGQNKLSPSAKRAAERSQTFPGLAIAMAEQWGGWDGQMAQGDLFNGL